LQRGIESLSDLVDVAVGQQNTIFRMVEKLAQREPNAPSRDNHVVFLHSRVQKLSHPGIRPLFLGEKPRMERGRPAQNDYRRKGPGCHGGASLYSDVSRKPIDAFSR